MTEDYQTRAAKAITAWQGQAFDGAKGAVFWRGQIVALLRDDRPDIAYPGMWDLPGGAREGAESPLETFTRETREETGFDLRQGRLFWQQEFAAKKPVWFLGVVMPHESPAPALGSEGQALKMMPAQAFCALPDAISHLQERLRALIEALERA